MNPPADPAVPRSGLCWYGQQKLPPLLDAFTEEIQGVKNSDDIEYIHRMRVASRRLRAALPQFASCFPEKQYREWMREITRITRALGEARDADVQIAFLQKTQKKLLKDNGQKAPKAGGIRPSPEPAIRFLLSALQKKRSTLQKQVLSAVTALEKSGVISGMQQAFAGPGGEKRAGRRLPPLHGIPPVSALRINKRLNLLLSYEPWVLHPEAVAEHHATRIAAKKLRYTMELYGALYRNSLKKPLVRVKKIQEILGDIHDCDVWIDHITTLLLRERTLLRSVKGDKRPDTTTLASLRILLQDREAERRRQYRSFVRYWQALLRAGLWDELRTTLESGRKARFRPPSVYRQEDAALSVDALAGTYPEIRPHSRHATGLALRLFDALQPLHTLSAHERFLLSCAGELHDIGWKDGRAGHNRRGAAMVFTDPVLPFDIEDRAILALIVFLHRGKVRLSACPYPAFLSQDSLKKALALSAILRVADGLDYPHAGTVLNLSCTVSADQVICTASGTGDIAEEKERAQAKADLFLQVFDRVLVIR